jgi:hypothetical protein
MNTQRIPIVDTGPGVSFPIGIRHEKQLCSPVGQPPEQPLNHTRILIVDDETAGYEVRTENDSTCAIDAAHEFVRS